MTIYRLKYIRYLSYLNVNQISSLLQTYFIVWGEVTVVSWKNDSGIGTFDWFHI